MQTLNDYFERFDEAKKGKEEREALLELFSPEVVFVLNGHRQEGKENFAKFIDTFFENNIDIHHVYEKWTSEDNGLSYETKWAVCGKYRNGKVFTATGKEVARIGEEGTITYLENTPDQSDLFQHYV